MSPPCSESWKQTEKTVCGNFTLFAFSRKAETQGAASRTLASQVEIDDPMTDGLDSSFLLDAPLRLRYGLEIVLFAAVRIPRFRYAVKTELVEVECGKVVHPAVADSPDKARTPQVPLLIKLCHTSPALHCCGHPFRYPFLHTVHVDGVSNVKDSESLPSQQRPSSAATQYGAVARITANTPPRLNFFHDVRLCEILLLY